MLIRELSRRTGVSVRSIRYYEIKNLINPTRLENGYRDYDQSAIERVNLIQLYLSLGLTTDDIAKIIVCPTLEQKDRPLCKAAYELYQAKLDEVNKQLVILRNVQLRLQQRIADWDNLKLMPVVSKKISSERGDLL